MLGDNCSVFDCGSRRTKGVGIWKLPNAKDILILLRILRSSKYIKLNYVFGSAHVKIDVWIEASLRSWRDSWAGEWRRSRHIPRGRSPQGISRAAKPRVKFPPATFRMGFACRPLLSLSMNQLNKPIREGSVTWNLRFISARNDANARDS